MQAEEARRIAEIAVAWADSKRRYGKAALEVSRTNWSSRSAEINRIHAEVVRLQVALIAACAAAGRLVE